MSARTGHARRWTVAALLASTTACSSGSGGAQALDCPSGALPTATPGRLVLATGPVTRAPWVVDPAPAKGRSNDPNKGQGYDAAVGYALAERLGYGREAVEWKAVRFQDALEPGDKDFDVDINQVSLREQRREAVDLSTPYFVVPQVLVSIKGRPVIAARTTSDLRGVRTAAVAGSPALSALRAVNPDAVAVPDLDEARRKLTGGEVDAIAVDYPTALIYDAEEDKLVDGEAVGLLPTPTGELGAGADGAEQYSLVLEKGSPLTPCVDQALGQMRTDGTLARLEKQWIVESAGLVDLRDRNASAPS